MAERVAQVARERDVPRAQVALAWLLRDPVVSAPVVGATSPQHLQQALGAVDLILSQDEIDRMEEPYVPHSVVALE